jgi:hypothetical protein
MFLPSLMLEIRTGLKSENYLPSVCHIHQTALERTAPSNSDPRFHQPTQEEWVAEYQNCVFGNTKLIWKSMLNCDARGANWR